MHSANLIFSITIPVRGDTNLGIRNKILLPLKTQGTVRSIMKKDRWLDCHVLDLLKALIGYK